MNRLLSGSVVALACVGLVAPPLNAQEKPVDFYDRPVSLVKVFGQRNRGEAAAGAVTGNNVYHASGLAVDRSLTPNAIYVFDAGNNRVLGLRSIDSKSAERVFGQPDAVSSAPNGDCNLGVFAKPSAASLCLTSFPVGTNVAEQWMRHHLDVDAAGNLYVADVYNDRVLVYLAPFGADRFACSPRAGCRSKCPRRVHICRWSRD